MVHHFVSADPLHKMIALQKNHVRKFDKIEQNWPSCQIWLITIYTNMLAKSPRAHFKPARLSVFCFSSDVIGLHVLFEATILLGLCIIRTNDLKSNTGTRPSSNNKFQVCANGSCRGSVLKLPIGATMSHGLLHFKARQLRSQYAYVMCTFTRKYFHVITSDFSSTSCWTEWILY
jgi:hypothetical protein